MNKNPAFNIMLAPKGQKDLHAFREVLEKSKIKTTLDTLNDGQQLMKYLYSPGIRIPHILFLDLEVPEKGAIDYLLEIRKDQKFSDLAIAIYTASGSDEIIEESFIHGANIFFKKPDDPDLLNNALSQIIKLSWQYHTSGMPRENFLLNLGTDNHDRKG